MKLPQLHSKRPGLRTNRRAALIFSGLLMAAVVFALVTSLTTGLFAGSAAAALGASGALQDEVRIQLGANGFTPAEVQHAAGTFAISVENSALSGEYTLRLKAQDGTVLREVQVQKGSAAWTMTLSAGEYTLTEAGHSQWLCRITVQ